MNMNDLRAKRAEILELAAKYGVANVRVFGSVARGEADGNSDVDFLIDVVDGSRFHWAGGGLLMDLQNLLGCRVDIATENEVHWYIYDRVMQEAKAL
jgi:uncharacterized protein